MKLASFISAFLLGAFFCAWPGCVQVKAQSSQQEQALFGTNPEQIKNALQNGANIEARDNDGDTPLLFAVRVNNADIVKLLLENHANIETKNNDDLTPLSLAVLRQEPGMVELLLQNHANIEARDSDGETPLIEAADNGNLEVVKLLLKNGADQDAKNLSGVTALNEAAFKTNCDVVASLEAGLQQKTAVCMQRLLAWYHKEPDDYLAKKAIRTAVAMNPRPEVPQEARRPFVQANTLFKLAQSDADLSSVLSLYKEALAQTPWFADAWYDQSLTQEKLGDYKAAVVSMQNFELLEPNGDKDQATLDRIYALEAKAK